MWSFKAQFEDQIRNKPSKATPNSPRLPSGRTQDLNAIGAVAADSLREILRMKAQEPFSISPSMEKRVQDLLARWAVGDFTGLRNAKEYHALVAEIHERIEIDATYAGALARLDELDVMSFQLRYKEYFPLGHQEFERRSQRLEVTQKDAFNGDSYPMFETELEALAFFETEDWTDIWERLRKEPCFGCASCPLMGDSADESPLVNLIQVLARLMDTWPDIIIAAIRAYVRREAAKQSRIAQLAAANKMFLVAKIIESDLRDLEHAPAACKEAVPAIRNAIFVLICRYFTIFFWDREARLFWRVEWRDESSNKAIRNVVERISKEPDELVNDSLGQLSLLKMTSECSTRYTVW
ncbi:hypothetical protein A9Z42_0079250 [Trichoderma parareesei]|uniref:Uncharacterized protein n=1 Tax=Trichoderma parareesei TaxID=858221 RepID=A0A2H3A2Z9_TRIPA|nr:hypothetical protein A9Z42_0079250 [Trichoderma parareesei]